MHYNKILLTASLVLAGLVGAHAETPARKQTQTQVQTQKQPQAQPQATYTPTPEIKEAQTAFQDAKFGVFIHWGIYSMLGQGEWVLHNQDINKDEYAKLASGFYPANFDAKAWVAAIKGAGAKYITITSRHHDSFSLFATKQSPYNMVDATPYGRDILKEIAQECKAQGLRLHFYYSTLDWSREDYPLGRTGKGTGRKMNGNHDSYFNFMYGQLRELLTNYGPIGCIWLDGHWDHDYEPDFNWRYDELYPLIHSLQPGCLIGNNHHITPIAGENIQIFERDVPGQNTAGWHEGGVSALPLETCQTMNRSWGYKVTDNDYKSLPQLIKYLVSTAGRNANLLLNVGPQPNGEIPAAALERLQGMGQWLAQYGESIYGTRSTLVNPQPWGVATEKLVAPVGKARKATDTAPQIGKGSVLYLHIFPDDLAQAKVGNRLFVPLPTVPKFQSATALGKGQALTFKQYPEGVFVTLPAIEADCPDYVIKLTW